MFEKADFTFTIQQAATAPAASPRLGFLRRLLARFLLHARRVQYPPSAPTKYLTTNSNASSFSRPRRARTPATLLRRRSSSSRSAHRLTRPTSRRRSSLPILIFTKRSKHPPSYLIRPLDTQSPLSRLSFLVLTLNSSDLPRCRQFQARLKRASRTSCPNFLRPLQLPLATPALSPLRFLALVQLPLLLAPPLSPPTRTGRPSPLAHAPPSIPLPPLTAQPSAASPLPRPSLLGSLSPSSLRKEAGSPFVLLQEAAGRWRSNRPSL